MMEIIHEKIVKIQQLDEISLLVQTASSSIRDFDSFFAEQIER